MASHHKQQSELKLHPEFADYVAQIQGLALPDLISPVRVAKLLDVDRRRVYELVSSGDLAAVRVGTRGLRIFRQSLLDWLRAGGTGFTLG